MTLRDAINSTQTNIVLANTMNLPIFPNFYLRIDSEIVFVRQISGRFLTVIRGSSPTSHEAGAYIVFEDTPTNSIVARSGQLIYRFFSLAIGTPAVVGNDLTNHITLFRDCVLKRIIISAKTPPVGSPLVIDIIANGTTTVVRLSITSAITNVTVFNVSALSANTILTVNIVQIGSSTAGQDIQVELELEI